MAFLTSGYFTYAVSFLAIYIALATVLHLQFHTTGIVNFGIVGFWGLGMYLTVILNTTYEIPLVFAILIATVVTAVVSFLLGSIILDLDGQAILVGTLAFATIIELLAVTLKSVTKGVIGIGTVKIPFDGNLKDFYYMLILVGILILLMLYAFLIKKAPYGRLLKSIKDNESLAQGLGKPTFRHKLVFFTLTSAIIALFGGLTAPLHGYLFPRMVNSGITFTIWIALLLGSKSKISGGVVGILATVLLFDFGLQNLITKTNSDFSEILPNIKYFVFGIALVLVLMFRPSGILGEKSKGAKE